jgi:hypothetical protein
MRPWCWLVVDRSGRYRLPAPGKILAATHGICRACKAAVRAQLDAGGTRQSPLLLCAHAASAAEQSPWSCGRLAHWRIRDQSRVHPSNADHGTAA